MKTIYKSGHREFVFETVKSLPSIEDLLNSTENCRIFIDSVTLNPKDVNAQLYSRFSEETYRLFIFSFAHNLGEIRSTESVHEQFEMNARRVKRLCKRRNISLSETEAKVIDYCINFFSSPLYFKEQVLFSKEMCAKLRKSYL